MTDSISKCVVYGFDIGKSLYHICGCDKLGTPILSKKLTRKTIIRFFANVPIALTGMEACRQPSIRHSEPHATIPIVVPGFLLSGID